MRKHLFLLASACLIFSACQQDHSGSDKKNSSDSTRSTGTTDTRGNSNTTSNRAQGGSVNQSQEVQNRRADDTGRNVRDRNDQALTSGNQSESEADRTITQKIRQSVVADDSLSTNAHNVKIITINGVVTLRGIVNNEREKNIVAQKARSVNGVRNIDNLLEIARSDNN